jgi:hypothetical protein
MSDEKTKFVGNATDLPPKVSRWVVRLASGWRPTAPTFAAVERVEWNGLDLKFANASSRFRDEQLLIELECGLHDDMPTSNAAAPLVAHLTDGGRFTSEESFFDSRGMHLSPATGTGKSSFRCTAFDWAWRDAAGENPVVWFASVRGRYDGTGNVAVRANGSVHYHGAWLEGASLRFFLLEREKSEDLEFDMLVFAPTSGMLSAKELRMDQLALRFCLGQHLFVEQMIGVDADGRAVEVRGTHLGSPPRRGHRAAPAIPAHPRTAWIAPLFTKLSRAFSNRGELVTASTYYVEAVGRFLDSEYLEVQVALEGLAKALAEHDGVAEPQSVRDRSAWKKWVKDHDTEIRSHAPPGGEKWLVDRIYEVVRRATGRLVADAFVRYGRPLGDEQQEIVGDRNAVAHTSSMTPDGTYVVDRDIRKIRMVRSMLVALICVAVGYYGKIAGWDRDSEWSGFEAPEDWWPVAEEDAVAARAVFWAEVPEGN